MIRFRWIYSSTLAYIVDANVGRSSTAVATNSAFRGIFAFVGSEVAIPLQVSPHLALVMSSGIAHTGQDATGDGGMYTIWAGVMVLAELLILLVLYRGGKWREESETREKAAAEQS